MRNTITSAIIYHTEVSCITITHKKLAHIIDYNYDIFYLLPLLLQVFWFNCIIIFNYYYIHITLFFLNPLHILYSLTFQSVYQYVCIFPDIKLPQFLHNSFVVKIIILYYYVKKFSYLLLLLHHELSGWSITITIIA